MAFSGLDLANAIKAGNSPFPPPPWVEHMRVIDENPIQVVEPGRIVTHWTPGKHFTVADGYVQGGLLSAMADGGQFLALVSTLETFEPWVTMDLHTRFVRPIKAGERIEIENRVLNRTKTSAVVESTFTLDGGKLAAKITGGWRKSDTRNAAMPETPG
jgi:acyl-coenzyme A thioesterase PaaI-like protein